MASVTVKLVAKNLQAGNSTPATPACVSTASSCHVDCTMALMGGAGGKDVLAYAVLQPPIAEADGVAELPTSAAP